MNKNFTTLEATYRIVTPMFCSGADQDSAELRLPSFKGALRFWWRSLMWGKVKDIADLRMQEAELFGTTGQKVGQSKVRMRLTNNLTDEPATSATWAQKKGLQYLGYGVMNFRGELSRPMIPEGSFTVQLRLGPKLIEEQRQQVQHALLLLGTVGGLGSKSRKGFGSLTLTSLKKDDAPIELAAEPIVRINSAVKKLAGGQPEWTAWSKQSRVLTVNGNGKRAVELLDLLGREQVYFRNWGNHGRVNDRESERNFRQDHDLSKPALRGKVSIQHPKRVAFGLPHNYQTGGVKPSTLDRRASPLFLHIHQASETQPPLGVVAFLPSLFLPHGERLQAFNKTVPLDSSDDFWSPIHGYLDRLIEKGDATKKQTNLTSQEVKLG